MKKLLAFLMCFLFVIPVCAAEDTPFQNAVGGVAELLGSKTPIEKEKLLPAGDSLSDWLAIAYTVGGVSWNKNAYGRRLQSYVTAHYKKDGGFGAYNATEWHRIAITAVALGFDPTSFGKTTDGKEIDLIADGTYNTISKDLDKQGVNALAFSLITLDTMDFKVPDSALWTRERILDAILSTQNADGGFGLTPDVSDPDLTAMVLGALAKYESIVPDAVTNAEGYMLRTEFETCETIAQWIIALYAMGKDAEAEAYAIRGEDLLSCLLEFALEDGTFCHSLQEKETNLLATEQAMLALAAHDKYTKTGKGLYDFTGETLASPPVHPVVYILPIGMVLLIFGVATLLYRRKKNV